MPYTRLEIMTGKEAAHICCAVFRHAGERYKRSILWDLPLWDGEERLHALFKGLRAAWLCGVHFTAHQADAFAWIYPLTIGATAANAHFFFPGPEPESLTIGREFMAALRLFLVTNLCAMLPEPFRHARNFIEKLGFAEAARVPNACGFHGKKPRTGVIYLKDLTREA